MLPLLIAAPGAFAFASCAAWDRLILDSNVSGPGTFRESARGERLLICALSLSNSFLAITLDVVLAAAPSAPGIVRAAIMLGLAPACPAKIGGIKVARVWPNPPPPPNILPILRNAFFVLVPLIIFSIAFTSALLNPRTPLPPALCNNEVSF